MSSQTPGAKPDLLIPFLILLAMLMVAYVYLVPFRFFFKGLLCMWYGILSFIVLDVRAGKEFLRLSEIMVNNYKYKSLIAYYGVSYFEDWMSFLIEQVRWRFFFFYASSFIVISFLLKKKTGHVPFFYGNVDLKDLITNKYGLKLKFGKKGEILEPVERVYTKVQALKRKKNFPINLVARFFPPDSKERVYLYTGSYSYRFQPVKIEKTLEDYLIEVAQNVREEETKEKEE